ncbi:hypothetical protein GQ44DRAFT_733407 [Phaeosphaeriaceae sp. PMI808]|nr:hypothetical protein GQ44DRAFT_733407 [Phaeosphaeriaceae sp. PMI808]
MPPKFSCNLLAAIAQPPWKKELDWDLHMTMKWEKRIPFASYVQATSTITKDLIGHDAPSFRFDKLPPELQLRILNSCSARTLFQLMRVSSALRIEASKLFWANPNAYFLVGADWLLDGGYPGYQCLDLAFLHRVQNVEIEYCPSTNNDIYPRLDERSNVQQDRVATFWGSLKRIFPQVKRVVINQNGEAGIWRGDHPVPRPLQILIQACPLAIQVSALVVEIQYPPIASTSSTTLPTNQWQRSIYQLTAENKLVQLESRHSKTIIMPTRQFIGPVGKFERLRHQFSMLELQLYSLQALAIEALDRHYFDSGNNNPFSCPLRTCNAYFRKAGEWTIHAVNLHSQERICFSILPNEIRAMFEEREKSLRKSEKEAKVQLGKISQEWQKAEEDKRKGIERIWAEQLYNNAGSYAGNNMVWEDFLAWTRGDY